MESRMDFKRLTEFMEELCNWRIPGCACDVYREGEMVYSGSAGFADMESCTPMDGDRLMFMYSSTKVVTATAAMMLVEEGRIAVNDPLSRYLPEFADVKVRRIRPDGLPEIVPPASPILVKHLFNMTSGYDYGVDNDEIEKIRVESDGRCPTRAIVSTLAKRSLLFDPGTHWLYGMSHDILAALVEEVSGMRFRDFVKQRIFDPVGMTNTTFGLREEDRPRLATLYNYNDAEGKPVREANQNNYSIFGEDYDSGGAGIVSNVHDMAKFLSTLSMGGVTASGERIISKAALELMSGNTLGEVQLKDFDWDALSGYGYGYGVRTLINPAKAGAMSPLGEFGWSGAAGAYLLVDMKNKVSMFYAHHMLNNQEAFTNPRLRNILYSSLEK